MNHSLEADCAENKVQVIPRPPWAHKARRSFGIESGAILIAPQPICKFDRTVTVAE